MSHHSIVTMNRASFLFFIASVSVFLNCANGFNIALGKNEEICLKRRNVTEEKTDLKLHLLEVKGLLSKLNNKISRMNAEMLQVKKTCDINSKRNKDKKVNKKVYASCLHALLSGTSQGNGVYRIKDDLAKSYSKVYCHMTPLSGCSGGGWTMVMKIDGHKETFSYSSTYWINKKSYSPNNGQTGLDDKETKLPTYWSTPFKELCVGIKIPKNSLHFIPIRYTAKSLHHIIADGRFHSTNIPRKTWKSLYRDSSLQNNCGRQGFNVGFEIKHHAHVRIGIIGNNENNCGSPDSFLGFGAIEGSRRRYCGISGIVNSCGNSAYCSPDNGNKEVRAMGYIFVR